MADKPLSCPRAPRAARLAWVVAVVACSCAATSARDASAGTKHPRTVAELVGRPAPKVIARDIRRTTPIKLSSFRGRPVLLVFFATWCRPCHAIEPALESLMRRVGPKRLTLLALSHESRWILLRRGQPRPAGYLVAQCTGRTALRYAAVSIPTLVLIDRAGVVRGAWQGIKPPTLPRVLRVIEAAARAR